MGECHREDVEYVDEIAIRVASSIAAKEGSDYVKDNAQAVAESAYSLAQAMAQKRRELFEPQPSEGESAVAGRIGE